jgi:hypothetical protein
MRTTWCVGFRCLIALVAAGFLVPAVQAAEVSSNAVVGFVLSADESAVPQPSVSATSANNGAPQARLSDGVPRRSLASIKVWKTCSALRFESNCARYA